MRKQPLSLFSGTNLSNLHSSLNSVGDIYAADRHGQAGVQIALNVAQGNLIVRDHVVTADVLGFKINLSMIYNSTAPIGDRWQLCASRHLVELDDNFIRLDYEDGHQVVFKKSPSSAFLFEAWLPEGKCIIEKQSDGKFKVYEYFSGETTIYASNGRLYQRFNIEGQVLVYQHNGSGKCIGIYDGNNNEHQNGLYINHNVNGNIYVSHRQGGEYDLIPLVDYNFEAPGLMKQTLIHNPGKSAYAIYFTHDSDALLTQITQSDQTSLKFTSSGTALTSLQVGGYSPYTVDYKAGETHWIDPYGHATICGFDAKQNLTHVIKPTTGAPQTTAYTYQSDTPLLTSVHRPNGAITTFTHDALGLIETTKTPLGRLTHEYHNQTTGLIVARVTYKDLAQTQPMTEYFVWEDLTDNKYRLRFTVSGTGIVKANYFNSQQCVVGKRTFIGNRFDTSHYSPQSPIPYETLNSWSKAPGVEAKTHYARLTYNNRGQILQRTVFAHVDTEGGGITDAQMQQDDWIWNFSGEWLEHRARKTPTETAITKRVFDGLRRLTSETDPLNHTTTHVFDDLKSEVITTLPNLRVEKTTHDKAGFIAVHTATVGSTVRTTTHSRDHGGGLFQTIAPDNSRLTVYHDPRGYLLLSIDEIGGVTESIRNDLGDEVLNIAYATPVNVGDLKPINIPAITRSQQDRSTHTIMDDDGNRWWHILADGAATQFDYDGAGFEILSRAYATRAFTTPNYDVLTTMSVPVNVADRLSIKFRNDDHVVFATQNPDGFVVVETLNELNQSIKTTKYATASDMSTQFSHAKPEPSEADAITDRGYNLADSLITTVGPEGAISIQTPLASGKVGFKRDYITRVTPPTPTSTVPGAPPQNPEDYFITFTRDLFDRVTKSVDSNDKQIEHQFDVMGQETLVNITDLRAPTEFRMTVKTYDGWEQCTAELGPRGGKLYAAATTPEQRATIIKDYATLHYYTNTGLRRLTVAPQNATFHLFYYDNKKLLLFQVNKRGAITEFGYNIFERETTNKRVYHRFLEPSKIDALTGGMISAPVAAELQACRDNALDRIDHFVFDYCGREIEHVDAEQYKTTRAFTAFGQKEWEQTPITLSEWLLTRYTYHKRGLPEDVIIDPDGLNLIHSYEYNFLGLEIQYIDPNHNNFYRAYFRDGLLQHETNPLVETTVMVWDARRRLVSSTNPLHEQTQHLYDQAKRSHVIISPMGRHTTDIDSVFGQQIISSNEYGDESIKGYDPAGALSFQQDPLKRNLNKDYSFAGLVESSLSWHFTGSEASALRTDYGHDPAEGLESTTVGSGSESIITRQVNNSSEKVVSRTDAAGYETTLQRDRRNVVTLETLDPQGIDQVTKKVVDGRHKVLHVGHGTTANPDMITKGMKYDKPGRKIADIIDPAPSSLGIQLEPASASATKTSATSSAKTPLNLATEYQLDANGNRLTEKDPSGNLTRYVYDKNNQKRFKISPMGSLKEWRYDAAGRVRVVATYKNRVNPVDFTNASTPEQVTAKIQESNYDRYEFTIPDADGKPVFKANRNGIVTQAVFDKAGRQTCEVIYHKPVDHLNFNTATYAQMVAAVVKTPGMDTYHYTVLNAAGEIVFNIDPTGAVVEQVYGVLPNKAVKKIAYFNRVDIAALNALPELTISAVQALIKPDATQDRVTHNVYNKLEQREYTIDAENYVTYFAHDKRGYLTTTTRYATQIAMPSTITPATIAAAITKDPAHDTSTTLTYNAAGKVIKKVDALNHSTSYQFNSVNLPVVRINAKGHDWTKHYDAALREDAEVGPEFDVIITAYDQAKEEVTATPTKARQVKITEYYPNGKVKSITTNPSTAEERQVIFTYDADNHMQTATVKNVPVDDPAKTPTEPTSPLPTKLVDITKQYVFDAQHNRVAQCDANGAWSFSAFDNLGRKIYEINEDKYAKFFEYDEKGQTIKTIAYADQLDFNPLDYIKTGVTIEQVAGWIKPNADDDRELIHVYDLAGRVIQTIQSADMVASPTDTANPKVTQASPETRYIRNAFGEPIEERQLVDPILSEWNVTVYKRDRLGREQGVVNGRGYFTLQSFNHLSKILTHCVYATALPSMNYLDTPIATLIQAIKKSSTDRETHQEYDAIGNNIKTTEVSVTYQKVIPSSQQDSKAEAPTEDDEALSAQDAPATYDFEPVVADLITIRQFDALRQLIALTDPKGNTSFRYYSPIEKLQALAEVPRDAVDFHQTPTTLTPITVFGIGLSGNNVSESKFPTCKSATIDGYELITSEEERVTIRVLNNVGMAQVTRFPTGAIEIKTFNAERKTIRQYRFTLNAELKGTSIEKIMQCFLTRFDYTPLGKQQSIENFRGSVLEFSRFKKYNAFGEVAAQGPKVTDLPEKNDYTRHGHVWRTNKNRGAAFIQLPDAAGHEVYSAGSRSIDLMTKSKADVPALVEGAQYGELVPTQIRRDVEGHIIGKRLPPFTTQNPQSPDPLILSLSTGDSAFGKSSIYWLRPEDTGIVAKMKIWPKGHPEMSVLLGEAAIKSIYGLDYMGYDLSTFVTDIYECEVSYFSVNPMTHEPYAKPGMSGTGVVNVITNNNAGSLHQVVSQVDEHTIVIAGKTEPVYGIELVQGSLSVAVVGATEKNGTFTINVSDVKTGDYQVRPIYTGTAVDQPFSPTTLTKPSTASDETTGYISATSIWRMQDLEAGAYGLVWNGLPYKMQKLNAKADYLVNRGDFHQVSVMGSPPTPHKESFILVFDDKGHPIYTVSKSGLYAVDSQSKEYLIGHPYNSLFGDKTATPSRLFIEPSPQVGRAQYVIVRNGQEVVAKTALSEWIENGYSCIVEDIPTPVTCSYQLYSAAPSSSVPFLPQTFRIHAQQSEKMTPRVLFFHNLWVDMIKSTLDWSLQDSLYFETLFVHAPDYNPLFFSNEFAFGRAIDKYDIGYFLDMLVTKPREGFRCNFSVLLNQQKVQLLSDYPIASGIDSVRFRPTQTLYFNPLPDTIKTVELYYYDPTSKTWQFLPVKQILPNAVTFDITAIPAGNYTFQFQAKNEQGDVIDLSAYSDHYKDGFIVDTFTAGDAECAAHTTATPGNDITHHPVESQTVDRWGNAETVTDALGKVKAFTYNHRDKVVTKTTPDVVVCDDQGDQHSQQLVYTTGHDQKGDVIGYRKPGGIETKVAIVHSRDNAGKVVRTTNPVGVYRGFYRNGFGEPTHIFNGNGMGETRKLNKAGKVTQSLDAAGVMQLFTLNAFNRRTEWTRFQHNGMELIPRTITYGMNSKQAIDLTVQPSGTWIAHTLDHKGQPLILSRHDGWGMSWARDWWSLELPSPAIGHTDLGTTAKPGADYYTWYDFLKLKIQQTSTTGNHGLTPEGKPVVGMHTLWVRNEAGLIRFLFDNASQLSTRYDHNIMSIPIGEFFRSFDGLVYQTTRLTLDALGDPIIINDMRMEMQLLYDVNRNKRALKANVAGNGAVIRESWSSYFPDDSVRIINGALIDGAAVGASGKVINPGLYGMEYTYDPVTGLRHTQAKYIDGILHKDTIIFADNGLIKSVDGDLNGPLAYTYDGHVCILIKGKGAESHSYGYTQDFYTSHEVHITESDGKTITSDSTFSQFDDTGLAGHQVTKVTGMGSGYDYEDQLDTDYVAFDTKLIAKTSGTRTPIYQEATASPSSSKVYTVEATYLPAGQMHTVEGAVADSHRNFVSNTAPRVIEVEDGAGDNEYYFYAEDQPVFRYGRIKQDSQDTASPTPATSNLVSLPAPGVASSSDAAEQSDQTDLMAFITLLCLVSASKEKSDNPGLVLSLSDSMLTIKLGGDKPRSKKKSAHALLADSNPHPESTDLVVMPSFAAQTEPEQAPVVERALPLIPRLAAEPGAALNVSFMNNEAIGNGFPPLAPTQVRSSIGMNTFPEISRAVTGGDATYAGRIADFNNLSPFMTIPIGMIIQIPLSVDLDPHNWAGKYAVYNPDQIQGSFYPNMPYPHPHVSFFDEFLEVFISAIITFLLPEITAGLGTELAMFYSAIFEMAGDVLQQGIELADGQESHFNFGELIFTGIDAALQVKLAKMFNIGRVIESGGKFVSENMFKQIGLALMMETFKVATGQVKHPSWRTFLATTLNAATQSFASYLTGGPSNLFGRNLMDGVINDFGSMMVSNLVLRDHVDPEQLAAQLLGQAAAYAVGAKMVAQMESAKKAAIEQQRSKPVDHPSEFEIAMYLRCQELMIEQRRIVNGGYATRASAAAMGKAMMPGAGFGLVPDDDLFDQADLDPHAAFEAAFAGDDFASWEQAELAKLESLAGYRATNDSSYHHHSRAPEPMVGGKAIPVSARSDADVMRHLEHHVSLGRAGVRSRVRADGSRVAAKVSSEQQTLSQVKHLLFFHRQHSSIMSNAKGIAKYGNNTIASLEQISKYILLHALKAESGANPAWAAISHIVRSIPNLPMLKITKSERYGARGGLVLFGLETGGADDILEGIVDAQGEVIPELGRSFRAANPTYPPSRDLTQFMNKLPIGNGCLDCSEITDRLFNRAGRLGSKLRITPRGEIQSLTVPERIQETIQPTQYEHHFVYLHKGYIYDPRLSVKAIPKGDYFQLLKSYNPSGFALEEETLNETGLNYRRMKP